MKAFRFAFSPKTFAAVLSIFAVQLVCHAQIKADKQLVTKPLSLVHVKGHTIEQDNKPPYSTIATFNRTVAWNLDLPIRTGLGITGQSYSIAQGDELGHPVVITKSDAKFLDAANNQVAQPARFKLTSLTVSADVDPLTAFKAYFHGWVEEVQDVDTLCQGKWGTTITLPVKPGAATIKVVFYGSDFNSQIDPEAPVPPKTIVIPATVEIKLQCRLQ